MYAKIIDGQVAKYPYTMKDLSNDNPMIGFGNTVPDEMLERFNVVRVVVTGSPEIDYTKNVNQGLPVFVAERNRWEQTWAVTDATQEQIDERLVSQTAILKAQREQAYREESDPIFFKWQRNEATQQEWLDKVAEIKARYP